jgi:hypothetical protein
MFSNYDPNTESTYRRQQLTAAYRAGVTRGVATHRRRHLRLPRRWVELRP